MSIEPHPFRMQTLSATDTPTCPEELVLLPQYIHRERNVTHWELMESAEHLPLLGLLLVRPRVAV
jgi:hypothetical protein